MKQIIIRTSQSPIFYIHELHGAVYITWTDEKDRAAKFPVDNPVLHQHDLGLASFEFERLALNTVGGWMNVMRMFTKQEIVSEIII